MKAAVITQIGKPLELMDVHLPSMIAGTVLVEVLCGGICGAQLQEIDGKKGDPKHLPHLLGHEGSGIIKWTSSQVTRVKRGDKVVIHWRKGEGCDVGGTAGEVNIGPCTTFSEYTVVSENRVTAIPSDIPDDLACLFGCCLSTALATVENVARVQVSESVLVIGAGGVGLAMILACRLAGAMHIVSTDVITAKWKLAKDIGATRFFPAHFEDQYTGTDFFTGKTPISRHDPVLPIPTVPKYDVIIDTCGCLCRANLLANGGRYIMVGQPLPEMTLNSFTAGWMFKGNGGRVEATQAGGFNPTKDIPRYVDMWREGKLDDYEKIITHRFPLDRINEGIDLMRRGWKADGVGPQDQVGRVLIEMT